MNRGRMVAVMNEVAVRSKNRFVTESVHTYLAQVADVLQKVPQEALERAIYRLDQARWQGQQVFTCGNGGSAATAIHFASDLAKGALAADKPPIKAQSLCDNVALLTAWANDMSYDDVFTQRMAPWVKAGDVLIAISGSGNSINVLKAVELANSRSATSVALTGMDGGRLAKLATVSLTVPSENMERVEDLHLVLTHIMKSYLKMLIENDLAVS